MNRDQDGSVGEVELLRDVVVALGFDPESPALVPIPGERRKRSASRSEGSRSHRPSRPVTRAAVCRSPINPSFEIGGYRSIRKPPFGDRPPRAQRVTSWWMLIIADARMGCIARSGCNGLRCIIHAEISVKPARTESTSIPARTRTPVPTAAVSAARRGLHRWIETGSRAGESPLNRSISGRPSAFSFSDSSIGIASPPRSRTPPRSRRE